MTSDTMGNAATDTTANSTTDADKGDTLVVVSKVKRMIREQSGCNTSQCCIDALTRKVIELATAGYGRAKASGRKTVMGKDIL